MTAIEIIALIIIAFSFVKIIVLAIRPSSWYGEKNPLIKIWSGPAAAVAVSLIIGAIILFYLLQEISISQILVAMFFGWIFLMLAFASYFDNLFKWTRSIAEEPHFLRKIMLSVIIWVALMIWVVWDIFLA